MALIIETGTGAANSESFASAADLKAYGIKFGLTLPAKDAELEALLRRAANQMLTMRWKGARTSDAQAQAFPRRHVVVGCTYIPSDSIPARIEYGQMALAAEIYADDTTPPESKVGPAILKRVEGAVTIEYAKLIDVNAGKVLPAAPDRPSYTQFFDYLQPRGLFAIRS